MTAAHDWTACGLTAGFTAVAGLGLLLLPDWTMNLAVVALARALAVLGLMVLWRTGLVSFGHALYYGLGAYTVALLGSEYGVSEILVTLPAATLVAATVGLLVGFVVRRYRAIFFAMLSLAFSMVLYGILVKTEALGSTDGFNVLAPSFLGHAPDDAAVTLRATFVLLCLAAWASALLVHRYLQSILGNLATAIRDNEIRVEYLGYSVARAIHGKYVMSAALAGLGGGFLAIALGQVDPDSMVNWPVSGELLFVTILSGPGNVAAPFVGSMIYELIRTYAFEWLPHSWQLIVGAMLLGIIFFLPDGIWSLPGRIRRWSRGPA